jgi:hypothetical protein
MIADDVKADIARAVRALHFEFGDGGTCGYRMVTGLFALRTVLKLRATPCFGSMILRGYEESGVADRGGGSGHH